MALAKPIAVSGDPIGGHCFLDKILPHYQTGTFPVFINGRPMTTLLDRSTGHTAPVAIAALKALGVLSTTVGLNPVFPLPDTTCRTFVNGSPVIRAGDGYFPHIDPTFPPGSGDYYFHRLCPAVATSSVFAS